MLTPINRPLAVAPPPLNAPPPVVTSAANTVHCTVPNCHCSNKLPPTYLDSNHHHLIDTDIYMHKDLHFTCVQCNLSSLNHASYMLHIKQTHCVEVYRCILCKQMQLFDNLSLLKEHFFQVHAAHKYEVIKCKVCPPASNLTFANIDELTHHVKNIHQQPRDRFNNNPSNSFHLHNQIPHHHHPHHQLPNGIHHGQLPPPVPSVTQQPALHGHNNDRLKCFKCQYCDSDFTQHNDLQQHIQMVHNHHHHQHNNNNTPSTQPPLSCQYCRNTFTNRSQLERHMRIHLTSIDLKCNICDRTFDNQETLAEHKLTHNKAFESPSTAITTTNNNNNTTNTTPAQITPVVSTNGNTASATCFYCKQIIENEQQFKVSLHISIFS